jgi:general secretion pathway protein K
VAGHPGRTDARSDDVMQAPRPSSGRRRERGFALLIVLWTLILLSLLVAHIAATGRGETQIAFNIRQGVQRQTCVDGAVFEAAFHVFDQSSLHWEPDNGPRELHICGKRIGVAIEDTANVVNLNTTTPSLMRALLLAAGVNDARASMLADAIVGWREKSFGAATALKRQQYAASRLGYVPPEAPFRSVDELGLVVGMSPDLLMLLKPHLTVWSGYGPVPTTPDPLIRGAMARVRDEGGDLPDDESDDGSRVIAITATEVRNGPGRVRYAVLRLDPTDRDRPCSVLAWEDRIAARD